MAKKILYRYERFYNYSNCFDEYDTPTLEIKMETFEVYKETECGYRIIPRYNKRKGRFVLGGDGRRFAHETKEMAWDSFTIRTRRSLDHARSAVERAEKFLELIKAEKRITIAR